MSDDDCNPENPEQDFMRRLWTVLMLAGVAVAVVLLLMPKGG